MHGKACTIICALQVEQGIFSELDSGHLTFSHLNSISKMAHLGSASTQYRDVGGDLQFQLWAVVST